MTEQKSKPRGAMVECVCDQCGNPFAAREADRKRGWARYCSKACKAKGKAASAPPKPKAKMGRPPYEWTREVEDEILMRMAKGESLRTICVDDWLPHRVTVRQHAIDDADFAARYARAREMQAEELVDEIRDIADDTRRDFVNGPSGPEFNAEHVQRSKLRIDSRKWMASKMHPKAFGDKIDVNHAGKVAVEQVKVSFEDAGDSQDE